MQFKLFRWLLLMLALAAGAAPAGSGDALLWFERGRPTAQALQAIDILQSAPAHGLDPADYGAAVLAHQVRQAVQAQPLPEAEQAQVDGALTAGLQRYLADRQSGRVDPSRIHVRFDTQREAPIDTLAFVREAVARQRLAEAVRETEPRLPMYASLTQALARYRALENHPDWQHSLPALPGRKLINSQPYAGLPQLARRLEALGDLPAGGAVPQRLEGELASALKAFQERHGLSPDGVLGQATLRQLDVSPSDRARQIELSLERLRWTPLLQGPRMIVVNVPEFVLRAYEVRDGQIDVQLTMKVIAGKAADNRTPLFGGAMRFIEFSPYWNVPASIAAHEIVPRLRRDPAYFDQQGFEFVGSGGQVSTTLAPAQLDAVLQGGARIRQRPGPHNALGDIKFVFPNKDNIYLHDTPAPQLFERDRRDFSHGCIRVQSPVALARFVLQGDPAWTEERIRGAMKKGASSTLKLKQPLPVLIAYSTVIAHGGRVFFYPDLYGHDSLLDQALRRRSAALPPLLPRAADAD